MQTQAAGSTHTPTAAVESGSVRASTSRDVQTQTQIQTQTQPSADTRTQTDVQARTQALTDTQTGKTIKSEGKVTELLQKAMELPADSPARQLAETLLSQQQTALIEQGLDLDSQYQLSHADQAQFAAETANNAVSDQALGELSRLVEQNTHVPSELRGFFYAAVDVIKNISETSLEKLGKVGIMEVDAILLDADPMLEVMGAGMESNPEQVHVMVQELESVGVEVKYRNGSMAYNPGLVYGKPGQFFIDENASYSAWLHEYKHFCDDRRDGFLGMRVFMDTKKCIQREIDAYNIEIELAKYAGRYDIVKKLEELKENEIKRYE